jgi:chromosome segregation ATPase
MKEETARRLGSALLALAFVAVCWPQVFSQQRRRPSRRATNPAAAQTPAPEATPAPTTAGEPRLVSTADEGAQEETPRRTSRTGRRAAATNAPEPEPDPLRTTVTRLSTQVEKLTEDISAMKSDQRALFDLERLNRAEQRAETLRAQLRDVTDKQFVHEERLAQIEDELDPASIQRRAALVGTLNPSAFRDQIQRSLERERERTRKQLELVTNSRSRLEAAVASSEAEVERLRQRLDASEQQPQQAGSAAGTTNATTATPTPTNTNPPAEPPR